MSDSLWTPGPWRVQPDEDTDGIPIYRIMFDHSTITAGLIATVEGQRVPVADGQRKTPGGEPNARLISAAPDLYEALEAATKLLIALRDEPPVPWDVVDDTVIDQCQAALKKARGE